VKKRKRSVRCAACRKKLGPVAIACRCGKKYCAKHRIKHDCKYDYKARQKERLAKANPLIEFNKITKI